jgi:hypothetical protein
MAYVRMIKAPAFVAEIPSQTCHRPRTSSCHKDNNGGSTIPITKRPHQSEAPVGAAPPTRSQLRLQWHALELMSQTQNGCHQPTLTPCQPMYIRPAHFDLPDVDQLTQPATSQAVERLAQRTKYKMGLRYATRCTITSNT